MTRFGVPLEEIEARIHDAIELVERSHAATVILRDGKPIAAVVSIEQLDQLDPPDPGRLGGDPLLSLCGTRQHEAFAQAYWAAYGLPPFPEPLKAPG